MQIRTKRVYDPVASEDGYRVLVDRVWPRGIKKEQLAADRWMKQLAPSSELRKWFNHDPDKWDEFKRRYFEELSDQREALDELVEAAGEQPITLLFAAKDTEHNQAVALKEYLSGR